jgi:hypothetical protein
MKNKVTVCSTIVASVAFGLLTTTSALPSALPILQQQIGCVASHPLTGSTGTLPPGSGISIQFAEGSGICPSPPGQCTWDLSAIINVPQWAGATLSAVAGNTYGGILAPSGIGSLTMEQEAVSCGGTDQSFSFTVTDSSGTVLFGRTHNLKCSACVTEPPQ